MPRSRDPAIRGLLLGFSWRGHLHVLVGGPSSCSLLKAANDAHNVFPVAQPFAPPPRETCCGHLSRRACNLLIVILIVALDGVDFVIDVVIS
ncbi:hypothetical protein IE81DRAFT_327183 [Ceraceosorus guamensis]|uniref:Uncharacterized protein n=1 Tax=Ceraceosorus guamensis TaxID=1522189 RepID=A0A316VN74_9BASI|nr:hypothetical protein IE81DRAFT_327183 [Ceraceosorus guamensis]PWN38754.1 hypothetical protein IE81DRAFT_327183 [Ceraceosorus guamensis]